jgi:hypothetical protein
MHPLRNTQMSQAGVGIQRLLFDMVFGALLLSASVGVLVLGVWSILP